METRFYHPYTLEEAVNLLEEKKAVVVNGGSDIILNIAAKKIDPPAIVFIRDIEGMDKIYEFENKIIIGGSVTYRKMLSNNIINEITGLTEACMSVGSPPIRTVGTPAGNLATAAPAADCATMLLALDSELVLVSSEGERIVAQKDIYIDRYKTVINRNEIIKEIRFLKPGGREGTGYYRLSRRKAQDIAKVIVGAKIKIDKAGICEKASVSLGALNATIVKAESIESGIEGLDEKEALRFVENTFPKEAGLRESYFKEYKEITVNYIVCEAVKKAFQDAYRRMCDAENFI